MVVADCTICLEKIREEAELDSCDHRFCFTCITKWSAAVTTCPLCKASFSTICNKRDGLVVVMEKEKLAMDADYADLNPSEVDLEEEEDSDGEWHEEENEEDRDFIVVDDQVDRMYLHDGDEDFEGDYMVSSESEDYSEEEEPIPEDEIISLHEASIVDNASFIRTAARRVMQFMSRSPLRRPERSHARAPARAETHRLPGEDEEGWYSSTRSGPSVYGAGARSTRSGVRRGRNPPRASRSTDLSRDDAFDHYREERIRRSGRVAARHSRARPY